MPPKADIWMPLYIGDYLADTSHLDAERHGCYLLWMMHYWRKGPLPNSIPDLVSIGKLRCEDASSIAQALLGEFFTMNGDGRWHQKRQDIEREKWQKKKLSAVEKAKKAAAGRWADASSIPQAMLEPCPLPLSLPVLKTPLEDSGSELMLANWLLEEASVPADNSTRRLVGESIRLLAKQGGTMKDAADFILMKAKEAEAEGETINRFWFGDRKYKPNATGGKRAGKSQNELAVEQYLESLRSR